jgi:TolA-binding protein
MTRERLARTGAALLAIALWAQAGEGPEDGAAGAALSRARAEEAGLRGLKGDERKQGWLKVAAAYQGVLDRYPAAKKEASEAALRLGRIYAKIKDNDMAVKCLTRVEEFSSETRNCALARMEIGHLYRRARQYDLAVAQYLKVVERFASEADLCADALEWVGKCREKKKDLDGAREAWRKMIEFAAEDPVNAVQAFDLIACSHAREKQTARAEEVLKECQARFARSPAGGKEGERIRKALERMRCLKLLDRHEVTAADGEDHEGSGGDEEDRDR